MPSTETWCSIVVVNLGNPLPFCQREQRELFIELLSSLSTLFEYLASTSKKHYGRPQHYYCHACPTLKTNFVLVQSISIGSDKCYLSSSVPLQITNANITSLCIDTELRRQTGWTGKFRIECLLYLGMLSNTKGYSAMLIKV